ncbi:MAG TPA: hypothetical protein EYP56_00805 [Planctomycetaceae bacterium]|nr:hypothetical protein [Planctomycetaceae bacterium]
MTRIEQVAAFLEDLAPTRLAESWDNVGLLVGDPAGAAERVMTCLSVTPSTAAEAVARRPGRRPFIRRGPTSSLWCLKVP